MKYSSASSSDPDKNNIWDYVGYLILLAMIIFHSIVSAYMQSKRDNKQLTIGHETAFLIIIGIAISYILTLLGRDDDTKISKIDNFKSNIIFYGCLPLIIFASGFNMKRKKFFHNSANILKFGIFGSILFFIILSCFNYLASNYIGFGVENETYKIMDILYLSAILSCQDMLIAR